MSKHAFQDVNAGQIVQRIMKSRAMYEERQRAKGGKAAGEEAVRIRERLEVEAAENAVASEAARNERAGNQGALGRC